MGRGLRRRPAKGAEATNTGGGPEWRKPKGSACKTLTEGRLRRRRQVGWRANTWGWPGGEVSQTKDLLWATAVRAMRPAKAKRESRYCRWAARETPGKWAGSVGGLSQKTEGPSLFRAHE